MATVVLTQYRESTRKVDSEIVCPAASPAPRRVPVAVKVGHTAFVITLIPVYYRQYGLGNFLWFSDVALLTSVPVLWFESPLLASTQAVGVVIPECLWAIDYGLGHIAHRTPLNLAGYMFDRRIPRFIRALSLFHLWLPLLLVHVISRVGYDRRALRYQAVVTCALLTASWQLTKPEENVNWVYTWRDRIRSPIGRAAFVLLLMAAIPLAFQVPVHLAFKRLFSEPAR